MDQNQNVSQAEMIAELERLRTENANLKAKGTGLKVSEKGAVSLYGIGRFPTTLYAQQWEKLLEKADEIKAFIQANRDKLSVKPGKTETQDQVNVA